MNIYVLTGQSNSLGCTADPAESGAAPVASDIDAQIPFWWGNVGLSGNSAGEITTLQVQQSTSAENPIFWGPEFNFARKMFEAGQRNFMIIKVSRDGGGNGHWSKSGEGLTYQPKMYEAIIKEVTEATTALAARGDTFKIVGLMYLQGESDSPAEANASAARLETLIVNLRKDLPNASDMRAVIGGICAGNDTRDLVRKQQSELAATDPTIDYFDTTDLRPLLYDGLHFNREAKMIVGARYAEAFLAGSK